MVTAQRQASFLDSSISRILALILALLLAILLWMNYADDFKNLFAGNEEAKPAISTSEPAKPANAALEACLEQRVGDVDRMKEEGILSDAKYEAFKSRAVSLCKAQNPGG